MMDLRLIATRRRDRPLDGGSHPVGAEIISKSLAGLPQYTDLSIWFHRKPGGRMGLFAPRTALQKIRGTGAIPLLKYREILQCAWQSSGWSIIVRPVTKSQRPRIAALIQLAALPDLRQWLETPRPDTWFEGQHVLQIGVDDDLTHIATLETHNDRIVAIRESSAPTPEVA